MSTPQDPPITAKVFYAAALEAMFIQGLGNDLSPEGRARLSAAGLELGQPLRASYPAQLVRIWVSIAREDLYPGIPNDRADELLGRRLTNGFGQTLIGKATLQILRLLGPVRAVRRIDENMRQLNNFSHAVMERVSDHEARYLLNEAAISPAFARGSLAQLLEAMGMRATVEEVKRAGPGLEFRVRWE